MGDITNLATTGNYATEANGLKVSYSFKIDNENNRLISFNGKVTEKRNIVDEMGVAASIDVTVATFHRGECPEMVDGINMELSKGRAVELASAIVDAVAALESKISQCEALETIVE